MDYQMFVDLTPRDLHPESEKAQYGPTGVPQYTQRSGYLRFYYPQMGQMPIDPYGPNEQGQIHPVLFPRQSLDVFRQQRGRIPIYAFHYDSGRLVSMEDLLPDSEIAYDQ